MPMKSNYFVYLVYLVYLAYDKDIAAVQPWQPCQHLSMTA